MAFNNYNPKTIVTKRWILPLYLQSSSFNNLPWWQRGDI